MRKQALNLTVPYVTRLPINFSSLNRSPNFQNISLSPTLRSFIPKTADVLSLSHSLSLSPKSTALVRTNRLLAQTLPVPMAFTGKADFNSGMSTQVRPEELQARLFMALSGENPAQQVSSTGTGFETLPPLAISFKPFQLLKSVGLKSVGLELGCVPFHSRWELVEWRPQSTEVGGCSDEILEVCDEIEEKEPEVFGPQIELDLGEGFSVSDCGEPPIEIFEEMRTGKEPVLESVEDRTGTEPVQKDVEMGTGDMPVPEISAGEPLLVLNLDERGSRPWLGVPIYHGSGSL